MNWTTVIKRLHRRLTWARSTRAELHRKKDAGPDRAGRRATAAAVRRVHQLASCRCDRSTYTLTVLGVEGFLPGYGVYEGGITASAQRGFARQSGPRAFDLYRSNVVALREFVPGNRLYANRGTFYVARYHLGAEETARIRTLRVNVEKGYVTEQAGDASYGQSGGVAIDALPLTDLDLAHESRITEDETCGSRCRCRVLGRLRKRNRGGKAFKIGDQEVSYVRGQGIELVNLGEAGRVKQGELGHWICSVCGAAKTPYAVPAEIAQFMKIHKERCGRDVARLGPDGPGRRGPAPIPCRRRRSRGHQHRRSPADGGDPAARHGAGRPATADRAEARRQARPADLRPDARWFGAAGADAGPVAGTHRHGEGACWPAACKNAKRPATPA